MLSRPFGLCVFGPAHARAVGAGETAAWAGSLEAAQQRGSFFFFFLF
jgi:hypothetical protein